MVWGSDSIFFGENEPLSLLERERGGAVSWMYSKELSNDVI